MKSVKTREEVLARVEELKLQINQVSDQIEKDRKENDGDDSSVLHELLDKKDFLEQSIDQLLESIKNNVLPGNLGRQFKVNMNGTDRTFKVVHPTLADSQNGYISTESPIAMALEGNRAGDHVEIDTPAGKQTIKILEISYM